MNTILKVADRHAIAIALLAGVGAVILIMLMAAGNSVWFDEGYSILLARESYGELLALTAVDAHPPLYYILLKLWGDMFGFQEFTLRLLSALFMGGAVSIALLLTKRLFGVKAFLIAIPALLLAPFLLRYGYEIRMYALATLIGVSATYALVRAQETQSVWRWVVYAALVAFGMYTLYMTIAIWFAHVVWLVWTSIKTKQKVKDWRWLYAFIGAVLLFTPYILTFFHQLTKSALPGMGNQLTLTVLADVMTVLSVFTPEWLVGGWLTLLLILAGILMMTIGVRAMKQIRGATRSYAVLYVCLAVVPLLFYALSSLPPRDPVFVVRYMAHVSLWLYLLGALILAYGYTMKSKRLAIATTLVSIVVIVVGVTNVVQRGNYIFERDQTPMTQELRAGLACDENTTVVADDPYTFIDTTFYFQDCDMRFYSQDTVEKKGGYAPLHASQDRVAASSALKSDTLVHLHWGEPAFVIDDRYEKIDHRIYGKQHVDSYRLNGE